MLYVKALAHIEAGHADTLCMAGPAVTAVLAYVVLGERMETMQIVGAIGQAFMASPGLLLVDEVSTRLGTENMGLR